LANSIVQMIDHKLAYDRESARGAGMHNLRTSGAAYAGLTRGA
jgi:hypothetical protein